MSDSWRPRRRRLSRTDMFDFSFNLGLLPASRASIEALPKVHVTKEEAAEGSECPICLDNYEVGSEARVMPCKHRFHSGCIEKWLGLRKSCPICRFVMPAEKKKPNWSGEAGRRGVRSSVSVGGSRGSGEVEDTSDPMDVDAEVDEAWMDVDDEVDDAWDPMEVD